jgi:hypothetical protein
VLVSLVILFRINPCCPCRLRVCPRFIHSACYSYKIELDSSCAIVIMFEISSDLKYKPIYVCPKSNFFYLDHQYKNFI